MDVALVIRQRFEELELDQRDLARAASVTESYVSQILTRKKAPPAPDRTDIYDRMDRFLKLPQGELARVAEVHLKEERRRRLGDLAPLFPALRTLLLRKCARAERETVRAIIERQSFGELERLVAQTLLQVAHVGADVLHITPKQLKRLGDAIASWEWEPASFALTIRTTAGEQKRFEYEERRDGAGDPEKGLEEFLRDPQLSGSATPGELALFQSLRFNDRGARALYYYLERRKPTGPTGF